MRHSSQVIQQKIVCVHLSNAVQRGRQIFVERDKRLGMVVAYGHKRGKLAIAGRFISYGLRHLVVAHNVAVARDEIDLTSIVLPDKYVVRATQQLEIDDVFKHPSRIACPIA